MSRTVMNMPSTIDVDINVAGVYLTLSASMIGFEDQEVTISDFRISAISARALSPAEMELPITHLQRSILDWATKGLEGEEENG